VMYQVSLLFEFGFMVTIVIRTFLINIRRSSSIGMILDKCGILDIVTDHGYSSPIAITVAR
jgi:hypothetical protein